MLISATSVRVIIFTASFAGIHTFVAKSGDDLGFQPFHLSTPTGGGVVNGIYNAGQYVFTLYLDPGDIIHYEHGPEMEFHGVRLGDEL